MSTGGKTSGGSRRDRSKGPPMKPSGAQQNAYGSVPAPSDGTSSEAPSSSKPDLENLGPIMSKLEGVGLFRSDSMDLSNDPRLFQGSILDKRMAAFSGLQVVAGLMCGTSLSRMAVGNMDFFTLEGKIHAVQFLLIAASLLMNIIATYVSVAQIYHVYRLETAGPTGFEMATSYYLNQNIVAWRHLAIKCLLLSLPIFLVCTGMQLEVDIGSAAEKPRPPSLLEARICGCAIMVMFFVMGAIVWYIHAIHAWIFKDRYEVAMENQSPYLSRVQSMMTARRSSLKETGRHAIDV